MDAIVDASDRASGRKRAAGEAEDAPASKRPAPADASAPSALPAITAGHAPSQRSADPIAAAQAYSQHSAALGLRRYDCHLCNAPFASGRALNDHLEAAADAPHAAHRERMRSNQGVSKQASIEHRAAMEQAGVARETGVVARVVFVAPGDAVRVVGRLEAPDNAWQLEGGRICKLKTEGQRWRWECDWRRQQAEAGGGAAAGAEGAGKSAASVITDGDARDGQASGAPQTPSAGAQATVAQGGAPLIQAASGGSGLRPTST